MLLIKLVRSGEDGPEEYGFEASEYYIRRKHVMNEAEMNAWLSANFGTCHMPFGEPSTPCTIRVIDLDSGRRKFVVSQGQADVYVMSQNGKTLDAYHQQ